MPRQNPNTEVYLERGALKACPKHLVPGALYVSLPWKALDTRSSFKIPYGTFVRMGTEGRPKACYGMARVIRAYGRLTKDGVVCTHYHERPQTKYSSGHFYCTVYHTGPRIKHGTKTDRELENQARDALDAASEMFEEALTKYRFRFRKMISHLNGHLTYIVHHRYGRKQSRKRMGRLVKELPSYITGVHY